MRKRIGEILVEKGVITEAQLMECLGHQKVTKEYIGTILIKKRLLTEDVLLKALSEQLGIPFVSLKSLYIDWNVCQQFSPVITMEKRALPIKQDDTHVIVAVSDPLDMMAVSEIEAKARPKKLKLVLVSPGELDDYIMECKKKSKGSLKSLLGE